MGRVFIVHSLSLSFHTKKECIAVSSHYGKDCLLIVRQVVGGKKEHKEKAMVGTAEVMSKAYLQKICQ